MTSSKKVFPFIEPAELEKVHTSGVNYKKMDKDITTVHYQYMLLNGIIPNTVAFYDIDVVPLIDEIIHYYNVLPANIYKEENYNESTGKIRINKRILFLRSDLTLVQFEKTDQMMLFYSNTLDHNYIQQWVDLFANYFGVYEPDENAEEGNIWILRSSYSGISLEPFKVPLPRLSIDTHYNDDFLPVHQYIMKRLQTTGDNGLVLLHGDPGTGKTTYMRYLSGKLNKKLIYLSREIAHNLLAVDFVTFMLDHPNSILVIEDAEDIVSHNTERSFSISSLLNIADGLLSDCLNLQVICTFNTHIRNIDKALLRKGRLIALYEFKALFREKANALSVQLGYKPDFKSDASLAQIYNQKDPDYSYERSGKIGFK
ncbi:MAG: AAA family ATPase [Bacteroidales bacterium]